jgi:uncharacterized phiE125 gp8 family phage protein
MLNSLLRNKKGNRVLEIITEPAIEPVSVDEVKVFGRIDNDEEDTLIAGFISYARHRIEDYTNRALITQTLRMTMDYWDEKEIELLRPPLISVTSVQTIDESNVATTYDATNYYVIGSNIGVGRLVIKKDSDLPENTERDFGGFRINYTAGYGSTPTNVPEIFRICIMLYATILYEKRAVGEDIPEEIKSKLIAYRIFN